MTMREVDAALARAEARWEAAARRTVDRMRAEGREPAPDGDHYTHVGDYGHLTFSLRWPDPADASRVEMRAFATSGPSGRVRAVVGRSWPEYGEVVSAPGLLGFLARHWTLVGRHYNSLPDEPSPVELDLRHGLGRPDLPFVGLRVGTPEIFLGFGGKWQGHGTESLMVVESLMALGDTLAASLPGTPEAAAWAGTRDAVRVFPAPVSKPGVEFGERDRAAEVAFYAGLLGQDPADFRRAAIWVRVLGLRGEQGLWERGWGDLSLPSPLPPEEEVMAAWGAEVARYGEALSPDGEPEVSERCMAVRAALFYRTWPGKAPFLAGGGPVR